MTFADGHADVPVLKDGNAQQPIPSAWRSTIREIVHAFVLGDYRIGTPIAGVRPIPAQDARQIEDYIRDYGETLVDLPDDTWDSSVCIWLGTRWDALVDLWTVSEGRSDLVPHLHVSEAEGGFAFEVHMVYVP